MQPRVMQAEDSTGDYLAKHSRRSRMWVKKVDGKPSHQVELELDQTGHFVVRILSPLGEAFTSTQIHEGYLYEQRPGEVSTEEAIERG